DFAFEDALIADEEKEDDALFGLADESEEDALSSDKEIAKEELLDEDGFDDLALSEPLEESTGLLEEDELLSMSDESTFDELGLEEMDTASLMDDDELGDLESKIEDAVSGLEMDDLERELESDDFDLDLNDESMEELMTTEHESADATMDNSESFDELDMLDERELKMAVGEEVEEEIPTISMAEGASSLAAETLDEVMNEAPMFNDFAEEIDEGGSASHAEGVEALQALLKALSNENVTKSLKGMNISININFGNDK
ncbi:hypothetical protein, partial [Sulfuricurvum sp.]|uniref:hypothetical protein n=1 Tax=Sulfuricurvum sp. TaxID=2025608 RepID=UPI0025D75BF1